MRRAVGFGPASPQAAPVAFLIRRMIGAATADQSEDCLYLNVWTPAADHRRRPVMVWLHGGGFVMGAGSTSLYTGFRMARRGGIVVVTLNYRLGALGFLNLRGLRPGDETVPSNLGLRDQMAALEWVRDNIEEFGGDPENVTLFGESAGGMSVGTLLGTPRAQGLFHRAILQSGAAHNVSSKVQGTTVAEHFLSELGLDTVDMHALCSADVSEIIRAQRQTSLNLGMPMGTLPWQPSVDGDLLPAPPLSVIANGLPKSVPVLVGTNRDEWKLFTLGDWKGRRLDDAGFRRRVSRVLPGEDSDGRLRSARAFEVYRPSQDSRPLATPSDLWVAFQSDRIFHYPAMRLAELQSANAPATYSYVFTWTAPFLGGALGACHGLEIPFVFGTLRDPLLRPLIGATRAARELSRKMQEAWISFAQTGDPSHEGLPDWSAYDPKRRATMFLGSPCSLVDSPFEEARRFWEQRL